MEIPKILWLKNNLINSYERIDKFFDLADFLQYKASGSDIRSSCTLACKWTYLAHKNSWDKSFFEVIGLSDLLENKNIGTTVKEPGSLAGFLTKESALELGLHENVKVSTVKEKVILAILIVYVVEHIVLIQIMLQALPVK